MSRKITRRRVLQGAAATVAAPLVIPSSVLGDETTAAPSQRVALGQIGAGTRGRQLLRGFFGSKDAQYVAIADCYRDRREGMAAMTKSKAYQDHRELLARDDIDAVIIATPDHWHVPLANAAARAGKDCYVEKPLGVTIEEDLVCRKVFQQNKRIFQYGTQQRSSRHCRLACELVRAGKIGKVHTIEVIAPDGGAGGSTAEAPLPDGLDYDRWIGPAAMVPYANGRCNPPGSYWIYDYSIGYLAGWGAHPLDLMVWGSDADISGIVEVEGTGVIPNDSLYDSVIHWDMQGKLGDVNFTFKPGRDSTKFIGDEGWVRVWRGGIDAEPKSLLKAEIDPEQKLVESRRHDQNFLDAVKSRQPAVSPIEDAVRSDIISHLCNIAVRVGRKVRWDPKTEQILDDAEAAKLAQARPMREPWTL